MSIMELKEATLILNNLLHVCETPSQDRLTFREKEAIKLLLDNQK